MVGHNPGRWVMSMKHRVNRLQKRVGGLVPDKGPLTLFYMDATPDFPVGSRREVWGGIGLEIAVRPGSDIDDGEWPLIPGGPHKIIKGPVFEV